MMARPSVIAAGSAIVQALNGLPNHEERLDTIASVLATFLHRYWHDEARLEELDKFIILVVDIFIAFDRDDPRKDN